MNRHVTYVIRHPPVVDGDRPRYDYEALAEGGRLIFFADYVVPAVRTLLGTRSADVHGGLRLLSSHRPADPIVVFGEDLAAPLMLAAMLMGDSAPTLSVIYHGKFLDDWRFTGLAKTLVARHRLRFLAISDAVRERVVRRLRLPNAAASTVGCATDLTFFAPAPPRGGPMIASAGTADRDYGTLIDATAGLGVPVRIAARSLWAGPDGHVRAAELPAHVELPQLPMHTGLRDLFRDASIVVVPLHESDYGAGYSVIGEAMAMGRPVIATRTRTPSDFIVDGVTGFYVPPGDVDALRSAIRSLLADPERAARMGAAGRSRMEEHFSLDGLRRIVEQCVSRDSAAAAPAVAPAATVPGPTAP